MIDTYFILNRKCSVLVKIFLINVVLLLLFIVYGINTFYYQTSIQLHSEILSQNSLFYLVVFVPEKEVNVVVESNTLFLENRMYSYSINKIDDNIVYKDGVNYQMIYLNVLLQLHFPYHFLHYFLMLFLMLLQVFELAFGFLSYCNFQDHLIFSR